MYSEISSGILLLICPFLALSLCAVRSLAPIAASPPPELELSKLSGQIDPSRCLRTRVDGFSRGGSSVIIRCSPGGGARSRRVSSPVSTVMVGPRPVLTLEPLEYCRVVPAERDEAVRSSFDASVEVDASRA